MPYGGAWAELRRLSKPPKTLAGKIVKAIELEPCDWLFVHRDAEGQNPNARREEIEHAWLTAKAHFAETPPTSVPEHLCVVPIRMQEAWLLFHEQAIRTASGNPNGTTRLMLPPLKTVETVTHPKHTLHEALRLASELRGRRLKDFNPGRAAHRVAELIEDFSPLRALGAFQTLEHDVRQLLNT